MSPEDISLDMSQSYSEDQIQDVQLRIFKFAVQYYYTILQRSQAKFGLPDVSRFLKAYINYDVHCARWFVHEFTNCEMLEETLLQNR